MNHSNTTGTPVSIPRADDEGVCFFVDGDPKPFSRGCILPANHPGTYIPARLCWVCLLSSQQESEAANV